MNLKPTEIFKEYEQGVVFKSGMGAKGLYEQTKINERFFAGDQWHGVGAGGSKPLVRHNIVRRIGEYKMSQILTSDISVKFSAKGISSKNRDEKAELISLLTSYRDLTAERLGLEVLLARALKDAYISGSGVIYTYFDTDTATGLFADEGGTSPIKGDIKSEVISISDVYFADPYLADTELQKYIIIASLRDAESVKAEAAENGADKYLINSIKADSFGKVLTLTKFYKEKNSDGSITVKCIKVCERAVIKPSFDTGLRMYPITVFLWDERDNCAYGDTEATYLIPNQIAINRMITASVWSGITMGMPMMVVNGDTVSEKITNDPGQIIKVFGTNEDVAGAVKYITPPDVCSDFGNAVDTLIKNTLTQSGANDVALGDSRPDNAAALRSMQTAAVLPLRIMKRRFYNFIEQISRIWADFWITQYGTRKIEVLGNIVNFCSADYKNLYLTAIADVTDKTEFTPEQVLEVLNRMLDKEIITKNQYVKRLPKGLISDTDEILKGENENDGE